MKINNKIFGVIFVLFLIILFVFIEFYSPKNVPEMVIVKFADNKNNSIIGGSCKADIITETSTVEDKQLTEIENILDVISLATVNGENSEKGYYLSILYNQLSFFKESRQVLQAFKKVLESVDVLFLNFPAIPEKIPCLWGKNQENLFFQFRCEIKYLLKKEFSL